ATNIIRGATTEYGGIFEEPHAAGSDKPRWLTEACLRRLWEAGACPTRLTLGPGEYLHINKGRLHAFRKMQTERLPQAELQRRQRQQLLQIRKLGDVCISVAWDWLFQGGSAAAFTEEIGSALCCAAINREMRVESLAVTQTAVYY
ncbi:unnamed protein product, partial [Phaeothamnion confervicola]